MFNRSPREFGPVRCALLLTCLATTEGTQQPIVGQKSCQVSLEEVVTIADVGSATGVIALDEHRLYVAEPDFPREVRVFDLGTGEFIRSLGREGQGPGEFQFVRGLQVVGDSVHVFDAGNLRHSVWGPGLELGRENRMEVRIAPQGATLIEGVGMLVNGWVGTPTSAGEPLHLYDREGRLVRSFGSDPFKTGASSMESPQSFRWIQPDAGPRAWVSRATEYVVEHWDVAAGKRLATISRRRSWFPEDAFVGGRASTRDPPGMLAVWQSPDGLLWVLGRKAQGEARPIVREARIRQSLDDRWDTVLDVIDPASDTDVATLELPYFYGGFLSDGRLYTYAEGADLTGRIVLWNTELSCPPSLNPTR